MESFPGGVFDKTLEGGRAGAQLTVSPTAVRAETPNGQVYEVTGDECRLELGGASGKMWFCRSSDQQLTLFCEAPGFDEALAQMPPLADSVRRLRRHRRAERRRSGLFFLGALSLLAVLAAAAYYGLQYASRAAVAALPAEADRKIGRMAVNSLELGGSAVRDPIITEAVEDIVDRLAKATDGEFRYHVQVIDADTLNAFALPGGELVVYTGLLAAAEAPDEVAGVLAHEIAHVTERHGIKRIAQSLGLAGAVELLLGDLGGLSAVAVEMVRSGALMSYSRDQEREADVAGTRLLARAGFDPAGLARMLTTLAKSQASQGESLPEGLVWLSSHPDLNARIARVEQLAGDLDMPERADLEMDWQSIRGHLQAPSLIAPQDAEVELDEEAKPPQPKADTDAD